MPFNGVNNKEHLYSLAVSNVDTCLNSMCLWIVVLVTKGVSCLVALYNCSSVAAHRPGSFLPTPFPPSFHCFNSVLGVCSPYYMGAHGWIARICQPWEQSSSRSWLPIVEDLECPVHTTCILTMQLLNELSQKNVYLQKLFWLYPPPHSTLLQ